MIRPESPVVSANDICICIHLIYQIDIPDIFLVWAGTSEMILSYDIFG
jgi:hypothetical protein